MVFAANTAGTIIGAGTGGLVLLPLLGIKGLIELGVLINLLVGGAVLAMGSSMAWAVKGPVMSLGAVLFGSYLYFFPSWDKNVLASGAFRHLRFAGVSYQDFKKAHNEKILYYKDGANVTVTVSQYGGDLNLKVNGKPDASTRGDLATQILLAQIPLLLKPDARDVLVIGLGSGITAGSALAHPVESLDVVEISPEVVEANRFFSAHNRNALKDPRLKLHIEDGKTFLRTTPRAYDLIISEPSNPWIAGVGNLFSLQFYQDVRDRLRPGGVMVQWFHTYEMTDDTLRLLLRTFAASFEQVTLWSPKAGDLLLLARENP
jgi:spermidine synthase